MKKFLIVLFLMAFCLNAHAAVVPTSVSGGTVDFSNGYKFRVVSSTTVTFNSVTKHIWLQNNSTTADCYVNIECKPTDLYAGSAKVYTVRVPAAGGVTPSVVELDFATERLSFWAKNAMESGTITYIVTGEAGDL